ncbi:MAG: hypothetical protein RL685_168 [Pseudomonadota bacterium]
MGRSYAGLWVGLTTGLVRAYAAPEQRALFDQDTAPTIGAMAQYNYLFGPGEQLVLGVGVGARTPLVSIRTGSPLRRLDGDVRLVAGAVF